MLQRCEAAGVKLLTYGSVGGGLLSDKHAQPPKKGLFGEGGRPVVAHLAGWGGTHVPAPCGGKGRPRQGRTAASRQGLQRPRHCRHWLAALPAAAALPVCPHRPPPTHTAVVRFVAGGDKYPPVDLSTSSLKMYMGVVKRMAPDGVALWRRLLGVLRGVADRHGVSVAAVALRWVMQQGAAAGTVVPIVGVRAAEHVADNAAALALALDQADLDAIAEVLEEATGPAGDCYSFEREG